MASKHKIRANLKIGTKNTRIGVPRELEGWMKTTLYRDNTTSDNCQMELIGASACCNLQGRPLTVSLTWLLAEPP